MADKLIKTKEKRELVYKSRLGIIKTITKNEIEREIERSINALEGFIGVYPEVKLD